MNNNNYSYNRENANRDRNVNTIVPKEIPVLDKKTYVKKAEEVIGKLKTDKYDKPCLSTSQIRNILTLVNEAYNIIQHNQEEVLSDEVQSRTQYIKMRIAYSAGRDTSVKDFVEKSGIMVHLDRAGESRSRLILVCNYMEALVAYHKFNRGVID